MYIYVDEPRWPDVSKYVGPFTIGNTSKYLAFGNAWFDGRQPFDGDLDEIRISVVTPEPAAIAWLAAAGALMRRRRL